MTLPFGEEVALGEPLTILREDFIRAILGLIREGWQLACSRSAKSTVLEVPLTELLRDGMRDALSLSNVEWKNDLLISLGTESRSTPGVLVPDGRTDIPLYLWSSRVYREDHNPHVIVECKRIAMSNGLLVREYVLQGIDRFVSGKYGSAHALGFMVGYVVAGDPGGAVDKINRYLGKLKRIAERLLRQDAADMTISWLSKHTRSGDMPAIALHHVMLEFAVD